MTFTAKPMFALHKDKDGKVLAAKSWKYSYEFVEWVQGADIRSGDTIEFGETATREDSDFAEAEPPAFLETPAPAPVPATVGDDQPF